MTAEAADARPQRVYAEAIVVDMHNDMPSRMLEEGYDPDVRHPPGFGSGRGQTDLPRLLESGITAQFMAAWVDARFAGTAGASFARAMTSIDAIRGFVTRHPQHLELATTAGQIRAAKTAGRIAILIGVEGGHAIESSLDRLRTLHERGARYLTFTWNNGVSWAGSSIGLHGSRKGGLTSFGREVVRELNRLGMMVDLSHVSDPTFDDAIACSAAPVIASHSSVRAINDSPRNLGDEQLRAIAATGGVVNVNFYSRFLDPVYRARVEAAELQLGRERQASASAHRGDALSETAQLTARRDALLAAIPPAPFDMLIDHFEHVASVAGTDHVGLGSDFDGVAALPAGMDDVTCLPRIATALVARGWADADVTKLLGGNMMRVMDEVLR